MRFAARSGGVVDVVGTFVSRTEITCEAPDFLAAAGRAPLVPVEVRVQLGSKNSFTTTHQRFTYFAATSAEQSLAFGPGLLEGPGAPNALAHFLIVARDSSGAKRTSGGDAFSASVRCLGTPATKAKSASEPAVRITDVGDGTYEATYSVPPGTNTYEVTVRLEAGSASSGARAGELPGYPVVAGFAEGVAPSANAMSGAVMADHLRSLLVSLKSRLEHVLKGLDARVDGRADGAKADKAAPADPALAVRQLVDVKELFAAAEEQDPALAGALEAAKAKLAFMAAAGQRMAPQESDHVAVLKLFAAVRAKMPQCRARIAPLVKKQHTQIKLDIAAFAEGVAAYRARVKAEAAFWIYGTGGTGALASVAECRAAHEDKELLSLVEIERAAAAFDALEEMKVRPLAVY